MLNKAILQGRLCADPELKTTQSGVSVLSNRIACDRSYKPKDGGQDTDFINIVAWRGTADFIAKYFHKGDMILVDGQLQVRDYTDRDGNKRYATEVVVDNVNFCGSKRDKASATTGATTPDADYVTLEDEDAELPF